MSSKFFRPAAMAVLLGALALGSVQAQTSVNVYGLMDLSIGRNQAPGGVATKDVDSGKMTTSYFGFKGSEDLGGGLKASFAIESFLRGDTGEAGRFNGDPFWARSAWVGLGGGFGSVNLGRNTTSLFVNTLIFNPFGDSFGYSPSIRHYFTSGTTTGDTGWSDSVKYSSPRFGGASFTAHAAEAGANGGGRNYGLSGLYFGGPMALGFAWQNVKKGSTVADTKTWQIGASYDLKAVKLFGQYGKVNNDTSGNDYKIAGLGLSAPLGAGKALFQWGRISPKTGANRTTISLGYDYDLSKRTDVYAVYMSDKITGLSTGSNYGVGIRHRF
jgi:predicted porin